ncbi:carboxymuconolactone decarboxylase family protein [Pseudidiomarina terrestris]|uniref:carboxymuconolactone decarboxylase family protein n=1 Tax=Pseudidiomarina terrestris TaxID=2820060 RepID=UPI0026511A08|nr:MULTISPECIES: carboxymuconolactone decarboxylase family protein [unclassified Pseudidiomarina]MDN7127935.1 carboxymuconolactone decarboxylase family protein [Pseudidiomarina sp. 1APR75-33.1]MDN7135594.1 carboxymuconolactone decarboxylase family protein [Pseudidiomarina sp. 1ASP75-5]MDN7137367.1 carboxymuconolactone decarboxylase family protein [Pseudidiomarina sp. 1ASP75-14]MEA3589104.1 carboxymuconolactone decarboxylase family protein [Pseudidiomarina sp. 1APP75-27a]
MAKFTLHSIDSAPEGSQERLKSAKEEMGMVPNLFAVMAESPELLEAYQTLDGLFQKSGFNKNEITTVWQTINVFHDCHYCIPAHTAIAKNMGADDEITKSIKAGDDLADDKLQALHQFTKAMLKQRGGVDDDTVSKFLEAGYEHRHVLAVVLGIAHKTMSNYTNHLAETPVDDPFKKFE